MFTIFRRYKMCGLASDFFYKMVNISLIGDDVNDYMHHNKISIVLEHCHLCG